MKKNDQEKYDWRITQKPEREYIHDYSKTLTVKMLMSKPDKKDRHSIVSCTFEEALNRVIELNNLTPSIHKIIYLVGWQFNGHDDGYPDMSVVNPLLKRKEDASAEDSLIWLMRESKKYNTTISCHVNFTDAYKESDLWDEYWEKGLISQKKKNVPLKIGKWNGRTAYQINYKNEWDSGVCKKKIDDLVTKLNLKEAGTVHIDAFFCRESKGQNIAIDVEKGYRRQIIRYFRDLGIDVTTEFLYGEKGEVDLIGLVPMIWWLNQSKQDYLSRPASLLCGGKPNRKYKGFRKNLDRIFGKSIHGEEFWNTDDSFKNILDRYCLDSLTFFYLNRFKRLKVEGYGKKLKAKYECNVVSCAKDHLIYQNNYIVRENYNVLVQEIWGNKKNLILYSREGYSNKKWTLPDDLKYKREIAVFKITGKGLVEKETIEIIKGDFYFSCMSKEAYYLKVKV